MDVPIAGRLEDGNPEFGQLALLEQELVMGGRKGLVLEVRPKVDEEGRMAMPDLGQALVKGHPGISSRGKLVAKGLVNSGLGVWKEIDQLVEAEPSLEELQKGLAETINMSRADSTLEVYATPIREWEEFASEHGGSPFPVEVALFLLFLQKRVIHDRVKGNKAGGLCNRVYGVDLMCGMSNLPRPGSDPAVKLLVSSAKRQLGRPTIKKKACNKGNLVKVVNYLVPILDRKEGINLIDLRTALFCSLGFVLEGRWQELTGLHPDDLFDYGGHMVAFIEVRKTSQYREGAFVPFIDSGEEKGVCNLLRLYLSYLPEGSGHLPLFRRLDRGRLAGYIPRAKAIGYSRMSELVKGALGDCKLDPSLYGLHSFRSRGATRVASDKSINNRLGNKHGGWVAGSAAQEGYVEESEENLMRVPLSLAL